MPFASGTSRLRPGRQLPSSGSSSGVSFCVGVDLGVGVLDFGVAALDLGVIRCAPLRRRARWSVLAQPGSGICLWDTRLCECLERPRLFAMLALYITARLFADHRAAARCLSAQCDESRDRATASGESFRRVLRPDRAPAPGRRDCGHARGLFRGFPSPSDIPAVCCHSAAHDPSTDTPTA